jgi:RNA polymerase sigma factor (sigma-70 family)
MDELTPAGTAPTLEQQVARARAGERTALEFVIRAVQPDVYNLALRFLWHPQDAEDATQEILIRVLTGLGDFRGEGGFRTWVYRVACNRLLTLRKQRMEQQPLSFDEFGEDLTRGLSDDSLRVEYDVDESLLLEEVKIGCTLAMLQCLDRDQRLAYILGDIIELDHNEAAEVLEITPAAYRKRLSRARASIVAFMTSRCGLVNPVNACRCRRRVATAVAVGRIAPSNLLFASSRERAKRFPEVLVEIRRLEDTRRAAALYQSHPEAIPSGAFVSWLKKLVDETPDVLLDDAASN